MKFSAATVLAAVAGAQAYAYNNVTYTTEVVTAVTTYCPGPTQITYGGETYTVSEVCWTSREGGKGEICYRVDPTIGEKLDRTVAQEAPLPERRSYQDMKSALPNFPVLPQQEGSK